MLRILRMLYFRMFSNLEPDLRTLFLFLPPVSYTLSSFNILRPIRTNLATHFGFPILLMQECCLVFLPFHVSF